MASHLRSNFAFLSLFPSEAIYSKKAESGRCLGAGGQQNTKNSRNITHTISRGENTEHISVGMSLSVT